MPHLNGAFLHTGVEYLTLSLQKTLMTLDNRAVSPEGINIAVFPISILITLLIRIYVFDRYRYIFF